MKGRKPDGKVTAEIGEERKRRFKGFLATRGLTFRKWLINSVDLIVERNNNSESEGK